MSCRTAAALTFCLVTTAVLPAWADCSDVAQPGVYWRRCLQDAQDLRGVDLTGANLRDASFKRADLSGATLAGIDGRRTKFVSATMQEVILDGAQLVRADLTKADLRGASLKGVDFTGARLFRANLGGADLTDARLANADMLKADFSEAIWIDGVTICAQGSLGQCNPGSRRDAAEVGPSG